MKHKIVVKLLWGSINEKTILTTLIFLLLIGIVSGTVYTIYYFNYMPNDSVVAAFETDGLNLVVEGEIVYSKNPPKVIDQEILLPIEVVKKYFDENIYWDDNLKKVTITTKDKLIRMKTNELEAMVNNKPVNLNIPAVEENGEVFIPIEFLSDLYNIDINYLNEQNVIIIDYRNRMIQVAEPIDEEAVIRKGRSIKYPIIERFDFENSEDEENILRIFEEYDKWYKVRANNGAIGYIEKAC